MAFNQFKLDIATEQTRGIFNTYVYQSDEDTVAQVQAAGYFIQSRFELVDTEGCNALIRCCCSDGFFEGFTEADGTIIPVDPLPVNEVFIGASGPTYPMTGLEDVIFCTGIVEILMISVAAATRTVIVNAEGGTVTMTPSGTDTIQTSVITDGNSGKFGPKASTSQWRDL